MILPARGLRLLLGLKLRGAVRKQTKRLRSPSGAIFGLLGFTVIGLWLASIAFTFVQGRADRDPFEVRAMVRIAGLFFGLLTAAGSLNHRGLYVPSEEIEPLFSAPVTRADVVRYRLWISLLRMMPAWVLFGLILASRAPRPALAFAGAFVALAFLPVFGQACSILSGAFEKRVVERWAKLPAVLLTIGAVLIAALLVPALILERPVETVGGEGLVDSLIARRGAGLLDLPVVGAASAPFEPWARMIAAGDLREFLAWAVPLLLAWALAFELTARMPIDFRELSLETSASVADRLRRYRRVGGGASASRTGKLARGWSAPWIFGHGPAGAIAWRKSTSILRKARGTLVVSLLVVGFLTVVVAMPFRGPDPGELVAGGALIAMIGSVYLCGGLRFDFREDLDRMEAIKTWPLPASRVFASMLLPQVVLISFVLEGAVLAFAAARGFVPELVIVLAGLPLLVAAWAAIDNVVFLFAPIRFVPGQESSLQNAGRAVVMMIVRLVFLAVVGGLVTAIGTVAHWAARDALGWSGPGALAAAFALGALTLLAADLALFALGGSAVRRFDVSRWTG